MSAQLNGIEIGRDVILKNMPPGEQMSMPKGITGIVAWESDADQERRDGP